MENISYAPILRWKKGEQLALRELTTRIENNISLIPIIELVEDVTSTHFLTTLKSNYSGSIFLDTSRIDVNNELLNEIIEKATQMGLNVWPLLYSDDVLNNFLTFTSISPRIAIRLPIPEDFDSVSNADIISYIAAHKDQSSIDLILDTGEILNQKSANEAYIAYNNVLSLTNLSSIFNQIFICLTSFPSNIEVESGGTISYNRYDMKLFKRLTEVHSDLNLGYSDYGVTKFTELEYDFSKFQYGILPKIKYTSADYYYILKGAKDHRQGIFTKSTIDMCKEIVTSSYFSGSPFSYGDKIIFEKATIPGIGPGNNPQWVTYCTNHHLAFVMEQLSTLI